jgi:hypothetical protein
LKFRERFYKSRKCFFFISRYKCNTKVWNHFILKTNIERIDLRILPLHSEGRSKSLSIFLSVFRSLFRTNTYVPTRDIVRICHLCALNRYRLHHCHCDRISENLCTSFR